MLGYDVSAVSWVHFFVIGWNATVPDMLQLLSALVPVVACIKLLKLAGEDA